MNVYLTTHTIIYLTKKSVECIHIVVLKQFRVGSVVLDKVVLFPLLDVLEVYLQVGVSVRTVMLMDES